MKGRSSHSLKERNELVCFFRHRAFFFVGLVIPTEKVKQPMRKKHRDFIEESDLPLVRLTRRSLQADDHVAEHVARVLSELSLAHRKREYIGRFVLLAIVTIQRMDGGIVAKENRYFRLALLEVGQHDLRARHDLRGSHQALH